MEPKVDDLRHAIASIPFGDIRDHAIAAFDAEVDIEVRHRHALGIQEAFEQQLVGDRIEPGDTERISDQRAGARAAARADRNGVALRPIDEIRDDQEIAFEAHLTNDAELELEALLVAGPCCGVE